MSDSANWSTIQTRQRIPQFFTRTIKIKRKYCEIIIGERGSIVQHFDTFRIKNLLTISLLDNIVKVTASTEFALDAVEARIRFLTSKSNVAILYKVQDRLICIHLLRFRNYYGIELEFDGKNFLSDVIINAELKEYLNFWVINAVFIDDEKVWSKRPRQKQCSFIDSVLLSSVFLRKYETYQLLDELREKEGIDYIDIIYEQTDVFAEVQIGCAKQQQYEECQKILREKSHEHIDDIVYKGHYANDISYPSKDIPIPAIPIPEHLRKRPSLMDLDLIADPCFVAMEINQTESMLSVTCTTEEALTRAIYLIMGALSFCKAQAGRKRYHCVYQEHYTTGCMTFDQKFTAKLQIEDSQCDTTSFCWDAKTYLLCPEPTSGERSIFSRRSGSEHCLYDQDIMISQFRRFLKFNDFAIIENLSVFVRFGLNRFVFHTNRGRPETDSLSHYLHYNYRLKPIFSHDLKVLPKGLISVLQQSENYEHSSEMVQSFTDVYFTDLSNNAQYSARIAGDNEIIYTRQVKQHHCHFRVIDLVRCKVDSMTVVASQEEVKDELIQEFLVEFIDSGALSKDGQMFMTNRFSIYNISKVTQTRLKLGNFVLQVDDVQKKTYQRLGKFANYCNVRMSYPKLDAALKELQTCKSGNKDSVVNYFVDILEMSDNLSKCMDKLLID